MLWFIYHILLNFSVWKKITQGLQKVGEQNNENHIEFFQDSKQKNLSQNVIINLDLISSLKLK